MLIRMLILLFLGMASASGQPTTVNPTTSSFLGSGRSAPYLGLVATRGYIPTSFLTTSKQMQTRTTHFARSTISSLQIVIPNWYINVNAATDEQPTGATATVTASVEYPPATFTQIKFSGAASGSIPSGATLVSDAASVTIPNGSTFYIRIWYSNSAGIPQLVFNGNGMMSSDGTAFGTTTPDLTLSGSVSNNATTGFFPAAIIAKTANPGICLWGSSRWLGILDTANANGDLGEIARSIGPSLAYTNMSASGDQIAKMVASNALRLALTQYCTTVITGDSAMNDLTIGVTPANVAALVSQFIALFPTGLPVWISTLTPNSTSTDGWTSVANQTTVASNAVRVAFNNNVRACGSGTIVGMKGCIDIASSTESSLNSGLWRVLNSGVAITLEGSHEILPGAVYIKNSGIVPAGSFAR